MPRGYVKNAFPTLEACIIVCPFCRTKQNFTGDGNHNFCGNCGINLVEPLCPHCKKPLANHDKDGKTTTKEDRTWPHN